MSLYSSRFEDLKMWMFPVQMENSYIRFHQANDISYNMVEILKVEKNCGNVVMSIRYWLEQLPHVNLEF